MFGGVWDTSMAPTCCQSNHPPSPPPSPPSPPPPSPSERSLLPTVHHTSTFHGDSSNDNQPSISPHYAT